MKAPLWRFTFIVSVFLRSDKQLFDSRMMHFLSILWVTGGARAGANQ